MKIKYIEINSKSGHALRGTPLISVSKNKKLVTFLSDAARMYDFKIGGRVRPCEITESEGGPILLGFQKVDNDCTLPGTRNLSTRCGARCFKGVYVSMGRVLIESVSPGGRYGIRPMVDDKGEPYHNLYVTDFILEDGLK